MENTEKSRLPTRGNIHDYLGMKLDFSSKGKVKIDMTEYTEKLLKEFREHYKLDGDAETPAGTDLFVNKGGELLNDNMREIFHTFVAKGLFMSKRSRPDIQPTIAVLACLLYTSPSPRDGATSRMPSSA